MEEKNFFQSDIVEKSPYYQKIGMDKLLDYETIC